VQQSVGDYGLHVRVDFGVVGDLEAAANGLRSEVSRARGEAAKSARAQAAARERAAELKGRLAAAQRQCADLLAAVHGKATPRTKSAGKPSAASAPAPA
jgi:hypothetical protein